MLERVFRPNQAYGACVAFLIAVKNQICCELLYVLDVFARELLFLNFL